MSSRRRTRDRAGTSVASWAHSGVSERRRLLNGDSGPDAYVRKYGQVGNDVWRHDFGSDATDSAFGCAVDDAGRAYVVGSTWGALPGGRTAGGRDAFAVRLGPPMAPGGYDDPLPRTPSDLSNSGYPAAKPTPATSTS